MDPEPENMVLAKEVGADRVELYTEAYANAFGKDGFDEVLETYQQAAQAALDAGLEVNAGHDLDLNNVRTLCEQGRIMEVSIGHALTIEALDLGWNNVVKAYLEKLA